jgi:hypothetical protein
MSLALRGAKAKDRQLALWSVGPRALALGLRSVHDDVAQFVATVGAVLERLFQLCVELTGSAPASATGG